MTIFKDLFKITLLIFSIQAHSALFITPEPPKISADNFVIMDYNSSKIIASKDSHKKHSPASLTKLMTSYVVFERIKDGFIKLNDEVTISKKAWKTGGSRSFLKVRSKIKLKTLLKGMIIQSGNDAAVALAEHVAGSEGAFVTLMNRYAQKLGMKDTNFETASGLPHLKQLSTSYDMALLSQAIIKEHPEYYKWYGEKYFTHNKIKQPNRNQLLWRDKTVDGLKTGHTQKAGYCLVASAVRDRMRLISVVLGSSGTEARAMQTQKLLDYGFRFFETQKIDRISHTVKIYKGAEDSVEIKTPKSINITLERGKFRFIKKQVKINKQIIAPIKIGQKLGEVNIMFESKILKTIPLTATKDIAEAGFFGRAFDTIALWF